jgi:hypothetical protein
VSHLRPIIDSTIFRRLLAVPVACEALVAIFFMLFILGNPYTAPFDEPSAQPQVSSNWALLFALAAGLLVCTAIGLLSERVEKPGKGHRLFIAALLSTVGMNAAVFVYDLRWIGGEAQSWLLFEFTVFWVVGLACLAVALSELIRPVRLSGDWMDQSPIGWKA